jgi:hypothetical protein
MGGDFPRAPPVSLGILGGVVCSIPGEVPYGRRQHAILGTRPVAHVAQALRFHRAEEAGILAVGDDAAETAAMH